MRLGFLRLLWVIMPAIGEDKRTGVGDEDTEVELVVPLLCVIPFNANIGGDAIEDVQSDFPKSAKLGKY